MTPQTPIGDIRWPKKEEIRAATDMDWLRKQIQDMQEVKDRIDNQLGAARRTAASVGTYADVGWYTQASAATLIAGRTIGFLQVRLGELRRAEKAASRSAFSERFVTAARAMLDVDTFTKIRLAAEEAG